MPQKYKVSSGSLELACKGNPALKQLITNILNWQSNFTDVSGIDPRVPAGVVGSSSLTPPGIVSALDVQGVNGHFIIKISSPAGAQGVLYYLLQSSETVPFEASTTVVDYGPTPNTTFDIAQPDSVLYWRVRAKFTNSDWGSWFGSEAVSSGSLDAVLSLTGTANQVIVSSPSGDVTLSLPQDVAQTSVPTFNSVIASGPAGTSRGYWFHTGANARWLILENATAEVGGNLGSDMQIIAYDDSGMAIDAVLGIVRQAGGQIIFSRPVLAGGYLQAQSFGITGGPAGVDGSFTTVDGKTVTVTKGLITAITP